MSSTIRPIVGILGVSSPLERPVGGIDGGSRATRHMYRNLFPRNCVTPPMSSLYFDDDADRNFGS